MWRFCFSVVIAGTGMVTDFTRYQVILDRSPFGPVRTSASGTAMPDFAPRYELVGLVNSDLTNSQVQAILLDKETKRSRFISAGETFEGFQVVRIDTQPARLILQHGLEVGTLTFVKIPGSPVSLVQPVAATSLPTATPTGNPWSRRGIQLPTLPDRSQQLATSSPGSPVPPPTEPASQPDATPVRISGARQVSTASSYDVPPTESAATPQSPPALPPNFVPPAPPSQLPPPLPPSP